MRIEMGYRHWKADLITEFDPFESTLGRFVKLDKPAFPGREALLAKQGQPMRRRFVTLLMDDATLPAHGGDSVMAGDVVVGTVTSADYGHRTGENLAMAFVDPAHAEEGARLSLDLLGTRQACAVVPAKRYG